jgi:hypothetical protein
MFDFKRFLTDHWSDADLLHSYLALYGFKYQRSTLYKWYLREGVPSEAFAILVSLLELESGKPVSVAKYLKETQ